jgi:hypothetical protein
MVITYIIILQFVGITSNNLSFIDFLNLQYLIYISFNLNGKLFIG